MYRGYIFVINDTLLINIQRLEYRGVFCTNLKTGFDCQTMYVKKIKEGLGHNFVHNLLSCLVIDRK